MLGGEHVSTRLHVAIRSGEITVMVVEQVLEKGVSQPVRSAILILRNDNEFRQSLRGILRRAMLVLISIVVFFPESGRLINLNHR